MKIQFLAVLLFCTTSIFSQKKSQSFTVVPLGIYGGVDESNLSSYMLAPAGTNDFICLDAGTIRAGIEKAISQKTFSLSAEQIQKQYIKGYFISHAHLDHVSGLIITSPDDTVKTVYALSPIMQMLQDYYFNGDAWANFGDEGKSFLIKKYHFERLQAGVEVPVNNTSMFVKAFPLSHVNPYESTAFLVRNGSNYVLYLGDTGSDLIEKSDKLLQLWQTVAPLVKSGQLKGIFIEVSYPNDQPETKLFGHLTPKLLLHEMKVLSSLVGGNGVKGLNIVVTHTKPPIQRINQLKSELNQLNNLGLRFIFPAQGKKFSL
jgi:cAMP phosphodiesterase